MNSFRKKMKDSELELLEEKAAIEHLLPDNTEHSHDHLSIALRSDLTTDVENS